MLRSLALAAVSSLALLAVPQTATAFSLEDLWVQHLADNTILLAWREPGPVDVYVSDRPSAPISEMRRISDNDTDGHQEIALASPQRPYFVLRSEATGETVRVAERLLPLKGGSNFRDVGGYPAADGKRVRWGLIYRTGAMPKLTDADYAYLDSLGVKVVCDLRTVEERQLAPTRSGGKLDRKVLAVDYPATAIFSTLGQGGSNPGGVYERAHHLLKPQFQQIFDALLVGDGPVTYNCSAGQDRTGIATALILTALGVPRDVIVQDYHLSTAWRRPAYERVDMDYAKLPADNALAQFYARSAKQGQEDLRRPQPLYTPAGEARLEQSFRAIEKEYGSVLGYLDKELGVDAAAIARLRAAYTE